MTVSTKTTQKAPVLAIFLAVLILLASQCQAPAHVFGAVDTKNLHLSGVLRYSEILSKTNSASHSVIRGFFVPKFCQDFISRQFATSTKLQPLRVQSVFTVANFGGGVYDGVTLQNTIPLGGNMQGGYYLYRE